MGVPILSQNSLKCFTFTAGLTGIILERMQSAKLTDTNILLASGISLFVSAKLTEKH